MHSLHLLLTLIVGWPVGWFCAEWWYDERAWGRIIAALLVWVSLLAMLEILLP